MCSVTSESKLHEVVEYNVTVLVEGAIETRTQIGRVQHIVLTTEDHSHEEKIENWKKRRNLVCNECTTGDTAGTQNLLSLGRKGY